MATCSTFGPENAGPYPDAPQGLALHPVSGRLYVSLHGERGDLRTGQVYWLDPAAASPQPLLVAEGFTNHITIEFLPTGELLVMEFGVPDSPQPENRVR